MTSIQNQPSTGLTAADMIKFKNYLIENLSRALEGQEIPVDKQREYIIKGIAEVYERSQLRLPDAARQQLVRDVLDEVLGFGPIQPLLDDPDVSEVMVNGPQRVYVEK